jgi:anti-sigma factor RsiW
MSNRTMVPVVVAPVHDFIAYQRRGGGRLQDFEAALVRLGREPRAHEAVMATLPRLTAAGYQLVGSRLCTFLDRELTALMYRKGERFLSLYIMPGSGLALPEGNWQVIAQYRIAVYRVQGYTNLIWQEGALIFSMVSELSPADMTRLF